MLNRRVMLLAAAIVSALAVTLARSQPPTPERPAAADPPAGSDTLDEIFSRIEKDLLVEIAAVRFESNQAKLERLFHRYETKARERDRESQLRVGAMYLEGLGVRENFAEAERWFAQAGGEDHPLAMLAHGKFCRKCREQEEADRRLHDAAVRALGKIGPNAAEAIPVLEQEITRREIFWNHSAADSLGQIGEPGVAVLIRLLESKDIAVRRAAAAGLSEAGADARPATAALTAALQDDDPIVRGWAERALKRLRAKESHQ